MKRNVIRWAPAVLAPVLIAATAIGVSVSANADVVLPDKSASQLLQFINTNPNITFSGKVTKVANLGLPNINLIPAISQSTVDQITKNMPKGMSDFIPKATVQGGLATAIGFLSGTQQANVYVDGLNRARVQVLDPMSERDFIRNGSDIWYYDASKQSASHHALTPSELAPDKGGWTGGTTSLPFDINSPASIANYLISQASPTTTFSVGRDARVAGEAAYTLTMTPETADSLIGHITISIDGTNGLPLAVAVTAVGTTQPAFSVSFDSITFAKPAASIFAFTPPAGTTVTQVATPAMGQEPSATESQPSAADKAQISTLQKEGWSAVVEIPAAQAASVLGSLTTNTLYQDLTKAVAGGRIFSTALLNVLITNDGRVFAGAVTPQKLLETATK